METAFSRVEMLLGRGAMDRLAHARVAIFGLGGVGGYVLEALARSGVGALDLIDSDCVALSNLNRQIIATRETLGQKKVDAAAKRVLAINPQCQVRTYPVFYLPETRSMFAFEDYDYVVDAIDTVTGKLALIEQAADAGVPILCALGTGNKLDPGQLRISDLSETSVDPLARIMRRECRRRGLEHVQVLWSTEPPLVPDPGMAEEALRESGSTRRAIPGSSAFVPAAGGLMIASRVVRDLLSLD